MSLIAPKIPRGTNEPPTFNFGYRNPNIKRGNIESTKRTIRKPIKYNTTQQNNTRRQKNKINLLKQQANALTKNVKLTQEEEIRTPEETKKLANKLINSEEEKESITDCP